MGMMKNWKIKDANGNTVTLAAKSVAAAKYQFRQMIVADSVLQGGISLHRMLTKSPAWFNPLGIKPHLYKTCQIAPGAAANLKNPHPRTECNIEATVPDLPEPVEPNIAQ